ncbi:MAG: biopolymer transporter ExbD [Blastochloris sp.]|nr:biopolymer transporter ExbD [Blastochloris sp.]
MKRHSSRFQGHVMTELNITPLLDLVFVLLIIFMITTPLIEQQISLNLPKSQPATQNKVNPKSVLSVNIDAKGTIFLSEKKVTLQQLEAAITQQMKKDSNSAVALRADAKLQYQQLVDVLDLIKNSGAKLGLATTPRE